MILGPFWAPFYRYARTHGRTDGGQAGPARPAPRAWISSRVRAAPPHSNKFKIMCLMHGGGGAGAQSQSTFDQSQSLYGAPEFPSAQSSLSRS